MSEPSSRPVRVRIAPSPTGYMHIGTLRTALYNWLFARKHGGTYILRVEDTDRTRLVEPAIEALARTFQTLDLQPDEGVRMVDGMLKDDGPHAPYLQSERREKHLAYAQELIKKGHAYYCFCSEDRLTKLREDQQLAKQPVMYDRKCRNLSATEAASRVAAGEPSVIRLAVPLEGTIVMEEMMRGRVEIPWAQVDDQVLIKTDGFPTYHLAAVCDDHDMEISHVIRGDDWLASLPKHVFLFQAMGWDVPLYAHLPLLLNADHSKLSKRQGDVAVEDYLAKGYLPEAIINFVALLGWNPTSDREIFSKEDLVPFFDIAKINKSGAVVNVEKLDWLNAQYLKAMSIEDYLRTCRPWVTSLEVADEAAMDRACLIVRERLTKLIELPDLVRFLFKPTLEQDPAIIPWKKSTKEEAIVRLTGVRAFLAERTESDFASVEAIDQILRAFIVEKGWGNGDTLWPLRVALSGAEKSPSPFELLFAYGKTRSLARIDEALSRLA